MRGKFADGQGADRAQLSITKQGAVSLSKLNAAPEKTENPTRDNGVGGTHFTEVGCHRSFANSAKAGAPAKSNALRIEPLWMQQPAQKRSGGTLSVEGVPPENI
jgi:hypothetical protein